MKSGQKNEEHILFSESKGVGFGLTHPYFLLKGSKHNEVQKEGSAWQHRYMSMDIYIYIYIYHCPFWGFIYGVQCFTITKTIFSLNSVLLTTLLKIIIMARTIFPNSPSRHKQCKNSDDKKITEIDPCQTLLHMLFKLSLKNERMSQFSLPGSAPAYLLRHLPQQRYKTLSDLAYSAYQHHSYSPQKKNDGLQINKWEIMERERENHLQNHHHQHQYLPQFPHQILQ